MCGCNKGKDKDKGKGKDKGKNECSKNICNNQKFTLVLTLKFKSGKTEKLKSHFISKSSQGGCDLPNEKPFKNARKKLLDKWRNSQKIEGTTKTVDTLTGIDTQVTHNSSVGGASSCKYDCEIKTLFGDKECGCCTTSQGKCIAGCYPC